MALNNDDKDGAKASKSSNPPNSPIARKGAKYQINFPVSPLLKKAYPATAASVLTVAPAPSHDQVLDPAPTNSPNNNIMNTKRNQNRRQTKIHQRGFFGQHMVRLISKSLQ